MITKLHNLPKNILAPTKLKVANERHLKAFQQACDESLDNLCIAVDVANIVRFALCACFGQAWREDDQLFDDCYMRDESEAIVGALLNAGILRVGDFLLADGVDIVRTPQDDSV